MADLGQFPAVKRILVTLGDPAGIGPEVIDAALASGDFPIGCAIEMVGERSKGVPGRPDARSAAAAMAALDRAASALAAGEVDAVVTGPVSKQALQGLGFGFPGQTEFFAAACGGVEHAMMLAGPSLTVTLATIHVPLADVSGLLSVEGIVKCGRLTAEYLHRRGVAEPRIAVAGLNPHAGEGGAFGHEEARVIAPAIRHLNALAVGTFAGPCVPDAVFREAASGRHDAVVAMYHDQGLIPLKLIDFDHAVNVTLGLPRPRTSPDHGTAFDIAGRGIANPSSMAAAIRLACELALAGE